MKRLWHRFWNTIHFLYTLGVAYQAWVLLTALATAAFVAWQQLKTTHPDLASVAMIGSAALAGMLLAAAPAVLVSIRQDAQKHEVPNPSLCVDELTTTLLVHSTGCVDDRVLKVTALGFADRFKFSVGLTGTGTLAVNLLSHGKKVGPWWRHDRQWYEIEFDKPLTAGDSTTIHLEYVVDDPDGTMRPYSRESLSIAAKYGSLTQILRFDGILVEAVLAEEDAAGSGHPVSGSMATLLPNADGRYLKHVPQAIKDRAYAVRWIPKR